jgi:hypothetical protein
LPLFALAVGLGALGGTAAFGGDERERRVAGEQAFESELRPVPVGLARVGKNGKETLRLPNRVRCRHFEPFSRLGGESKSSSILLPLMRSLRCLTTS